MTTTPGDLFAIQTVLREQAALLGERAADFPEPCAPCPPPVPCPPQDPQPAALDEVRDLFGHGGEYATRAGWEAAMGRPSRTRSMWAAGADVPAHVQWWRNFVSSVLTDDGTATYVVGMHPWPGQLVPPAVPPATYYTAVANELARLGARGSRVWIRFGWEPDGDWYVWSWRPKGAVFSEDRYSRYVTAWRAFDGALASAPSVRLTLSLTAGATPTLAERALRDLRPQAYTMDMYATYEARSVTFWQRRLVEQVEAAGRAGIPWGVDETSPYVDKVVGGLQRGALDSRLSVELLHALVWFVQVQAGAGRAPLWVQFFERNLTEGKFAIVSVDAGPALVPGENTYRSAGGAKRNSTAPRTAQVLVSLLGTPR